MPFDPQFAASILPVLLEASIITIQATFCAFFLAAVLGLLLAIGRRSRLMLVRWALTGAMEFIRSTPLLVQLYFLFFALPSVGIVLPAFLTGVLGLGIHYACYMAEVYRAAFDSVPKGQWEAAVALNYNKWQTLGRIILPQAIPPSIPVMANYLNVMFKDTPMLAAITVIEVMQRANIIASEKFLYVEPLTIVGLLFLFMSLFVSFWIRQLERRLAR